MFLIRINRYMIDNKEQPKPDNGRWNWWGLAEEEENGTDDE